MRLLSLFAGAGLVALAGCVPAPSTPPPAPARRPVPVPAAAPPPPVPALGADWRDWPLAPGDWQYRTAPAGGSARYGVAGAPVATLRCDRAARRVMLSRSGTIPVSLTLRTTSAVRAVSATSDPSAPGMLSMSFAANDSFLDAIGFSRGRFVIEGGGLPALVIPAWPEILRVVEDCRR